jgi:hypothetical protein
MVWKLSGQPVVTKSASKAVQGTDQETSDMISIAALCLMGLSCLPAIAATLSYEADQRPQSGTLHIIDKAFRGFGSLFPAVPWFLRCGAYLAFPAVLQSDSVTRHPAKEVVLHVFMQTVRLLVYVLHLMGQVLGVWQVAFGPHGHHLFADHVFLGVAVQASLAVELAAACHFLHQAAQASRAGQGRVRCPAMALLCAAAVSALALQAVVATETYTTGRFFHPPREILAAVGLGAPLFGVFVALNLHAFARPASSL